MVLDDCLVGNGGRCRVVQGRAIQDREFTVSGLVNASNHDDYSDVCKVKWRVLYGSAAYDSNAAWEMGQVPLVFADVRLGDQLASGGSLFGVVGGAGTSCGYIWLCDGWFGLPDRCRGADGGRCHELPMDQHIGHWLCSGDVALVAHGGRDDGIARPRGGVDLRGGCVGFDQCRGAVGHASVWP